jgi:hypothetical protein
MHLPYPAGKMSIGKEGSVPEVTRTEKILDLAARLGGLGFSAVYTQTHGSERASALRVAELAYRFLKGEPAEEINRSADEANEHREKDEREKNLVWVQLRRKKAEHNG